MHIFLSSVLHRADDATGWVTAFNATLPSIVAPRADHVTLVDIPSALTPADLDPSGLHPSQSEYDKMAAVWDRAIGSHFGASTPGLSVQDVTTNHPLPPVGRPYYGTIAGPTNEYISVTPDSLSILASTPNWFIHTGKGNDLIAVGGGVNVLDDSGGSNIFIGGTGRDTFFIDDRNPASSVWSSIPNFQAGDTAIIWGLNPTSLTPNWLADQGLPGATGLTGRFVPTAAGQPTASITLAGYTPADLTNGRLSISYGTTAGAAGAPGVDYLMIHGN